MKSSVAKDESAGEKSQQEAEDKQKSAPYERECDPAVIGGAGREDEAEIKRNATCAG